MIQCSNHHTAIFYDDGLCPLCVMQGALTRMADMLSLAGKELNEVLDENRRLRELLREEDIPIPPDRLTRAAKEEDELHNAERTPAVHAVCAGEGAG